MTKIRAATTHLILSAMVVGLIFLIIFFIWFPSPYFSIKGTIGIILILIGVDLVLGPFLTFIVYKQGKRSLIFDLSVIVLIQIAALIYGVNTIYNARPEYMVFAVDRFNVISKAEVHWEEFDRNSIAPKPFVGPAMYYADFPSDEVELNALKEDILFAGMPDLEFRPRYWQPMESSLAQLRSRTRSIKYLRDANPQHEVIINHFIESNNLDADQLNFAGVIGHNEDFTIIFDRDTGQIEGVININPWVQ